MTPRRATCDGCERPVSVCLCPWYQPVPAQTPVLILRHPDESGHALNTAQILAHCLQRCRMVDGESFLPEICRRAWGEGFEQMSANIHWRLLYPESEMLEASQSPEPTAGLPISPGLERVGLILLDGTWRNSRALLRVNPWLQDLPRMSVQLPESTRYVLRKKKPEGGSTLEACVAALAVLEPDLDTDCLFAALEQMMLFQREAMGEERFARDFGARLPAGGD